MATSNNLAGSGIYGALLPASGRKRILFIGDHQADQMYGGKLYRAIYKLHPNVVGWWSGGALGVYSSDDPVQCTFDADASAVVTKGHTGHAWDRYADPDDDEADGRNRVYDTGATVGDGTAGVTGNALDSDSPLFPSATQEVITQPDGGDAPPSGARMVTWTWKLYGTARDNWIKNNALEATVFVHNPGANATGANPIAGAIPWSLCYTRGIGAPVFPDGTGTLIAANSTGIQHYDIDITEDTAQLAVSLAIPDDDFDTLARRSVPLGLFLEATEADAPTGVSFVFYTCPWNTIGGTDGASATTTAPLLVDWEGMARSLYGTIGFDAVIYWLGTEVDRGAISNKSFADVADEMETDPYEYGAFDPGISANTQRGQGRASEIFADITHGFRGGSAQDADADAGVPVLIVLAGFAGQTDGLDSWAAYHRNYVDQAKWFVADHTASESKYTTGDAAYVDLARLATATEIMENQSNPWIVQGCTTFRGDWDSSTTYVAGDGVCLREADFTQVDGNPEPFRDGSHSFFVALQPNTNSKPVQAGTSDWAKMDFTRTVTGAEREWQFILSELNRSQSSGTSSVDVSSGGRASRIQRPVRSQR